MVELEQQLLLPGFFDIYAKNDAELQRMLSERTYKDFEPYYSWGSHELGTNRLIYIVSNQELDHHACLVCEKGWRGWYIDEWRDIPNPQGAIGYLSYSYRYDSSMRPKIGKLARYFRERFPDPDSITDSR